MENSLSITADALVFLNQVTDFFKRIQACNFIARWVGLMSNAARAIDGNDGQSAVNGARGQSAVNGDDGQSAVNGNDGQSAVNGARGKSAVNGARGQSAVNGDDGQSAVNGDWGKSAVNGDDGQSAVNGDWGRAEATGKHCAVSALGYRAAVRGSIGTLLMCSEYIPAGQNKYKPVGGFACLVDGKKVKPNCWYICEKSRPVEVDFTDGIFGRVQSSYTAGDLTIKKIIIDGDVTLSYVVIRQDGVAAHGKTIQAAKKDLIYKISNHDTSAYKDWRLDDVKSCDVLIQAYRAITGACFLGTKSFCESITLPKTATLRQAIELTRGRWGHAKFCKFFGVNE